MPKKTLTDLHHTTRHDKNDAFHFMTTYICFSTKKAVSSRDWSDTVRSLKSIFSVSGLVLSSRGRIISTQPQTLYLEC